MPQERRKSISYRSFVICDDPSGVVECQAIRKSNVTSPQKREQPSNKTEGEKEQQRRSKSLAALIEEEKKEVGIEEGIKRDLEPPTPSFQLSNVINSCSNGQKGRQKNVGKDLFRGALDLHKSLAMLKGPEKGLFGRLGDEMPCFSSRRSLDEMKKLVRESLLRQCVITNPVFEHHFDHGKQLGSPDMPSTSSSQSSMLYSSNFAPSDFSSVSSSSSSLQKMGKSSNLMFKLMGLESFPHSPLRHRESQKIRKPVYDIISPRARNPQFSTPLSIRQRSADEILEALKIKGLLKSNIVNGLMPKLAPSEVRPLENKLDDQKLPIVVMKPSSLPSLDLKEPIISKFLGDSGSGTGKLLAKSRPRRRRSQEISRADASNLSEESRELEGGTCFEEKGKTINKMTSSKTKASGHLNQRTQKTQENVKKASELVKVTPNRRKVEEKKVVKLSNELKSPDQMKLNPSRSAKKQKDGMLIPKNQNFTQQKTASTTILDHKMQKTSKRSSQREKKKQPVLNGKNQGSKGGSKEIEAVNKERVCATCQNDSALLTADSLIVKNFPSEKCTEACHVGITECVTEEKIPLSGPQEDVSMSANEDGNEPDPNGNQIPLIDITSMSISEHCSVTDIGKSHPLVPEVTLVTTRKNGIAVHLNALRGPTTDQPQNCRFPLSQSPSPSLRGETDPENSRKFLIPRTKLKTLMLSSPSFVSRAEGLFDLQIKPNSIPPASNEEDLDVSYTKLLLDCATEVMEFRSLQLSHACLPLPRSYKAHPRNTLSLARLSEDICNGIEDLKGYLSPATDMLLSDALHWLIDRDLSFKSGLWEIGWQNEFSQDEVEQVIGEVDKLVLEKFIEEVVVDLMS